jgi:hypothetical protein
MEMIVSNMWPIIWLLFMFATVVAFIVAAMREKSSKRSAATFMQPTAMPELAGMESMEMNDQDPLNMGDDTFR